VANTEAGLTQTSQETGFLVGRKRLKCRFLVQKPGFCVSPMREVYSSNNQHFGYAVTERSRSAVQATNNKLQNLTQKGLIPDPHLARLVS